MANNPTLPGQTQDPERTVETMDLEADDETDYDVEAFEDARINTSLIDPATKRPGNPTWEPYMNVVDAADLIMRFHEQHPHKPAASKSSPSPEPFNPSSAPSSDTIAVAGPARALPDPPTALPASHVLPTDDELPSLADGFDDKIDLLLMRIHSGITYTTMRLTQNLAIQQTTRFSIRRRTNEYKPSETEAAALKLLQAKSSPAVVVLQGPTHIVFELGMPKIFQVSEGGAQVVSTAQWWVGKSAAEIKAGPHADVYEIRKAAATLQGLETKRQNKVVKTKKEEEMDYKLAEGIRRQQAGLKMCDEDADELEAIEEVEEDEFDEY